MTKADQIHESLLYAKDRGDSEEIFSIATEFYNKVGLYCWSMEDVEIYNDHRFRVSFKPWDRDERTIVAEYDLNRNRWRVGSDVDLMEKLGVPASYLMGMKDAFLAMRTTTEAKAKRQWEFEKDKERLKQSQEAARRRVEASIRRMEKYKKKEEELSYQALKSKAVKAVTKEAGQKAAKQIAKDRMRSTIEGINTLYAEHIYPPVPLAPMADIPSSSKKGSGRIPEEEGGIPECSGVYFIWSDGVVTYVGQSVSLAGRVVKSHERVAEGDRVSWVPINKCDLDFAESFYIGILRPYRNFGIRSKRLIYAEEEER